MNSADGVVWWCTVEKVGGGSDETEVSVRQKGQGRDYQSGLRVRQRGEDEESSGY